MPKPKRNIKLQTPRGQISTYKTQEGKTIARLDWNASFKPSAEKALMSAQDFVDSECLRYMNPLIPRRTGVLIKSGTLGTVIGSGQIEYLAPYARRQYYENKAEGQRGAMWFERMKASHKETILEGAKKIVGNK